MLSLKAVLTSSCLTVFLSSSVLRKVVVACGARAPVTKTIVIINSRIDRLNTPAQRKIEKPVMHARDSFDLRNGGNTRSTNNLAGPRAAIATRAIPVHFLITHDKETIGPPLRRASCRTQWIRSISPHRRRSDAIERFLRRAGANQQQRPGRACWRAWPPFRLRFGRPCLWWPVRRQLLVQRSRNGCPPEP